MDEFVTLDYIARYAAEMFDLGPRDLGLPIKRKPYCDARAFYASLASIMGFSFPQMARAVGMKDHTTFLQAARRWRERQLIKTITPAEPARYQLADGN